MTTGHNFPIESTIIFIKICTTKFQLLQETTNVGPKLSFVFSFIVLSGKIIYLLQELTQARNQNINEKFSVSAATKISKRYIRKNNDALSDRMINFPV